MSRHPIGKPVKVVPSGDVPAALKWVGYAKKRAWELLAQGAWRRKVIHPDADTTIRIETLAGIPRVTIEVRGADYVCAFGLHEDGQSQNLWTGRLRSGAARVRGKSLYVGNAVSVTNLSPLGDGMFLGGPLPSGSWTGFVQFIRTDDGIPQGSGFAPWQPVGIATGIKAVCYSGLREDPDGSLHKRFHILYYYHAQHPIYPDITLRMPALATTFDGGQSFSVQTFYVPITEGSTWFPGSTLQARIDPIGITYFGNDTIAIVSDTRSIGRYLEVNVAETEPDNLNGTHTLLSTDGGLTWTSHFTSNNSLDFASHGIPLNTSFGSACYVGGSSLILTTNYYGSGGVRMTILRSDDYGQSFYLVTPDNGNMPPRFNGITPISSGAAGYIVDDVRVGFDGLARRVMHRTLDGGITWQRFALDEDIFLVMPGSIVLRETIQPPDPLPAGKVPADYAKLAVIWKRKPSEETPDPPYTIGLSDDGGATWYEGGLVGSEQTGYNVGIMNPKLPPFPGYPDLHKNGLTTP